MAERNARNLSLMDICKGYGQDKYKVAELMSISTPIVSDLGWNEATGTEFHKVRVRTSLPSIRWGNQNTGTPSGKSTHKLQNENMGYLDGRSDVDISVLDLAEDAAMVRVDQDKAFFESMAQEFERTFFYGDVATLPESFTGLANRFNSLTGSIGKQVVNANGSGNDNCSIYIITHGDEGLYGVYPKSTQAGIKHTDLGQQTVYDADTGTNQTVMSSVYKWYCGLAVANPSRIVRIANIDKSDLDGGSAADLIRLIGKGISRMQIPPQGFAPIQELGYKGAVKADSRSRTAIYCNRDVYDALEYQANLKTVNGLLMGQAFGVHYPMFRGLPIRISDTLVSTESTVS